MENSEFRRNAADMIYLTTCVINGKQPKNERIEKLDIPGLFEVCQQHSLTACTAAALESAGIRDYDFTQENAKAMRKIVLLDAERTRILKRLEAEKIWYMPLKGVLIKNWYPRFGMRQMSDNDILCDGTQRARIRELMLDMGFTCAHFDIGCDDAYFKPPVCNFEMHNELFHAERGEKMHEYYGNIKERLIKDDDNDFGYHFSDEDFYIYMIAHEYGHFSNGGTGVRSLADTYVFLRRYNNSLDWKYISAELEKLGIADFERSNRELAIKVFTMQPLTPDDKRLLDYYVTSGTYGTSLHAFENKMETQGEGSKLKYLRYRIFPPMNVYEAWYPWAYRHKILLPAAWAYRIVKGLTTNKSLTADELKNLREH